MLFYIMSRDVVDMMCCASVIHSVFVSLFEGLEKNFARELSAIRSQFPRSLHLHDDDDDEDVDGDDI